MEYILIHSTILTARYDLDVVSFAFPKERRLK